MESVSLVWVGGEDYDSNRLPRRSLWLAKFVAVVVSLTGLASGLQSCFGDENGGLTLAMSSQMHLMAQVRDAVDAAGLADAAFLAAGVEGQIVFAVDIEKARLMERPPRHISDW